MKRLFKTQTLLDMDLPWNAIEDEIISTSRWSSFHSIIFDYDGKFYQANYSRGLTEYQDGGPWEYEDEIEATQVHKVVVKRTEWIPIKDNT